MLAFLAALFTTLLQAQEQKILKSKHLKVPDTIWIFRPEGTTEPKNGYPAVFLLHGWSGSYHQWNDITNCQDLANRYGMIIVCPDALYDSWYFNSPGISQSQYADFFFQDLMPFVSKVARIDTKNIFITGLSMGGHGALYLFSQRPELFRSAGSMSGVLDLEPVRNEYRIKEYLGLNGSNKDKELLEKFSVAGNIGKIASAGKEIIFSCGTSDRFFPMNEQFRHLCEEAKINATYIIGPGGHNYPYWKTAVSLHLAFFKDRIIHH